MLNTYQLLQARRRGETRYLLCIRIFLTYSCGCSKIDKVLKLSSGYKEPSNVFRCFFQSASLEAQSLPPGKLQLARSSISISQIFTDITKERKGGYWISDGHNYHHRIWVIYRYYKKGEMEDIGYLMVAWLLPNGLTLHRWLLPH